MFLVFNWIIVPLALSGPISPTGTAKTDLKSSKPIESLEKQCDTKLKLLMRNMIDHAYCDQIGTDLTRLAAQDPDSYDLDNVLTYGPIPWMCYEIVNRDNHGLQPVAIPFRYTGDELKSIPYAKHFNALCDQANEHRCDGAEVD